MPLPFHLFPLGAPGTGPVHDPDRATRPTYTLTGGTIGRGLTEDRLGHWLLDVDLGGVQWRFSDVEVAPVSREDGRERVYVSGLPETDFEFGADSVTVALRGPDASSWARERRRLGPMSQRPFVLRRWYDGVLEDALVVLQGVTDAPSWGDPEDPAVLQLTLRRALRELSLELCSPDFTVDVSDHLFASIGASLGDEGIFGQMVPIVIGHPGDSGNPTPSSDGSPGFQGLNPAGTIGHLVYIVLAQHHVQAAQVYVWDQDASSNVAMDVLNLTDDLGRQYAAADGAVGDPSTEITVGWSRDGAWGGGLMYRGELVDGLGDVLRWGTETRSRAVYDRGEMESRRQALNRFRISCVINEPGTLWQDWLSHNLLDVYEIEEVHGPRGIFYVERQYDCDPSELRATLTTAPDVGGIYVQRSSAVVEDVEELANVITVQYAPMRLSTSTYRRSVTVGATTTQEPTTAGILAIADRGDIRCAWSRGFYGPLSKSFQIGTTWDDGTASAIAAKKVAKHALPAQVVSFDGGRELLDLVKYDCVAVYDQTPGADFRLDLGRVWGLTLLAYDAVRVLVRIPLDPLRRPSLAG